MVFLAKVGIDSDTIASEILYNVLNNAEECDRVIDIETDSIDHIMRNLELESKKFGTPVARECQPLPEDV